MLRHIILWQLKDEFTGAKRESIKQGIKDGLESLNGIIEGVEIRVHIKGLESSTADVMLDAAVNESAFDSYANHPEHKKVAVEKIRPFVKSKMVMDYITE